MSNIIKRETLEIYLILIATIISFFVVYNFMPRKGDAVVINCSISEISPDFTMEMKEACRQLRAKNSSKNLNKPVQ